KHDVVAALAEELIVARAAEGRIVAGATEQQGTRQRAVGLVEREGIIATQSEHLNLAGVRDRRRAARDRHGAAIDQDGPGRIAAGSDRIVLVVAEYAQHTCVRKEGGSDCHDFLILYEGWLSRTRDSREPALAELRPPMADGRCDAISRTVLITSDAHGFSGSLHESTAPLSAHDM